MTGKHDYARIIIDDIRVRLDIYGPSADDTYSTFYYSEEIPDGGDPADAAFADAVTCGIPPENILRVER